MRRARLIRNRARNNPREAQHLAEAERDIAVLRAEQLDKALSHAIGMLGAIKLLKDTNPTAAYIARQTLHEISLMV